MSDSYKRVILVKKKWKMGEYRNENWVKPWSQIELPQSAALYTTNIPWGWGWKKKRYLTICKKDKIWNSVIWRILPIIFRSILSENPTAASKDDKDKQLSRHFSGFSHNFKNQPQSQCCFSHWTASRNQKFS